MTARDDAVAAFGAAMRAAGIQPPSSIEADGKLRRFSTNGDRRDDAGWYIAFGGDPPVALFGDWRTGASHKWCGRALEELTDEEKAQRRRHLGEARRRVATDREREHAKAAQRAAEVWAKATPALADHPYLSNKRIRPTTTLREIPADALGSLVGYAPAAKGEALAGRILIAPIVINNSISSIEFIGEAGRKAFLYGGAVKAGYWATGKLPEGDGEGTTVLTGEGIATAISAFEATGKVAAAALSSGNMPAAARAVRARLPKARIVLLADLDVTGIGLAKAIEAARACGGLVAVPDFGEAQPDSATDMNDLAAHCGPEAVIMAVVAAREPGKPSAAETEPEAASPEPEGEPAQSGVEDEATVAEAEAGLPVIRIVKGELPRMVDEAEAALVAVDSGIYRHGGRLVRVVLDEVMTSLGPVPMLRLHPVVLAHLLEAFARAASFARFDRREKCWVAADCPGLVAASYLARGEWRLRPLLGVVTAPTLRPDGTILDRPGYDPATCLLFDPQGATFPPIPAEPTRDQAVTALEELRRLISKFDFVTPADQAVALSGILTAVARRALPAAPLHGFSSPVAGSGKSMLVNVAAVTATGKPAAVTSSGNDKVSNAELEKRIATSLMAGDAVVSIDNLDAPLGGELLCQALTERILRLRILGQSLNLEVPNTTMFFATGNQLTISGDATRRSLIATIDPMVERPELRVFDFDPVKVVEGQRGRYVAAALTVLRAYEVAGRPNPGPPLGSFNEWCARVRDPLLWLGEADPVATMEKARRGDPKLAKLAAVIAAWEPALGSTRVMTREVIAKAAERHVYGELVHPGLHEALLTVAQNRSGGGISGDRLGWWLKKNAERVVNGRRIVQEEDWSNASTWRLETVPAPAERWES